ncbi:hypothetical protein NEMIN01_2285 [Nematocida minor]|uniref:uncharacterized protein n=1 Tax=Nematocida minor TaxID=1912983 RepID=UPI00221F120E|nr:uncharacterized protein NEMIN01_2285 [Nematocida minor]KAI5192915.1 hypothetical protein NEMIN01_2285 [Nematocida minor]
MKEVKLKIDVEKVVHTCLSIIKTKVPLKHDTKKEHLYLVMDIFEKSLEVENCTLDNQEKEMILLLVLSNIYLYFTYNPYGIEAINNLHLALKARELKDIKHWAIHMMNEVIRPNTLIYRPEHGIHRQVSKNEALERIDPDGEKGGLSPRTCTLTIDDTKFLTLESLLNSNLESLDRESFSDIAHLTKKLNIGALKKYSKTQSYYSLEQLYTLTKNDMALVDLGLKTIFEKYQEIKSLLNVIKETENLSYADKEVAKDVKKLFRIEGELEMVISIKDNIKKIESEKTAQKAVISAIEYMANSTPLLKEMSSSNTLRIHPSLLNFDRYYISGDDGLVQIVNQKKEERAKKIARSALALEKEKKRKTPNAIYVNNLENEKYLLECEQKKDELQLSIPKNMHFLFEISPDQIAYIIKKMEKFTKARKIGVEIMETLEVIFRKKKLTKRNILKMFVLSAIVIVVSGLMVAYLRKKIEFSRVVSLNHKGHTIPEVKQVKSSKEL